MVSMSRRNFEQAMKNYDVYKVGFNVLLSTKEIDLTDKTALQDALSAGLFKKITNAGEIKPHMRYVPSASLPAAAAALDLGNVETPNWKDWLLPPSKVFYKMILGFTSSHYTSWKLTMLGKELGWIKSTTDSDSKFTTDDHPTIVTVKDDSLGDVQPKFKVYNYSQSTLFAAGAHMEHGWKYSFETIKDAVPKDFAVEIIGDVSSD